MKRKLFILTVFLSFYCSNILAQTAMGQWRTHLAYNSVVLVEQTDNKVFAVSGDLRTDGALFSVDKLDGNTEIYSKLTGLNGNIISAIKYDETSRQLIIGYNNGNIDLMTNSGIINIPDFHNKIMAVDKSINHIMVHGGRAYLSCNFGIIVLNLQRREIAETYYIGANASEVNVINTAVHENEIYALAYTQTGTNRQFAVFKASLNNPNLVDFRNWSRLPNLPGNTQQALASFAGKLFIQSDGRLFTYDNGSWNAFPLPNNETVAQGISVSQNKMIVANERNNIYILDEHLNITHLQNVVNYARAGVFDSRNNTYWFAGGDRGIISYNANTSAINAFIPSGPAVNTPWSMTFAGDKLFVVPGGRWAAQENRLGHVMIFENGVWTNISGNDIRVQAGMTTPVLDFMNVAVDPTDHSRFFVTSYGTGLYEFRNNQFYRRYLSELESAAPNNPQRYTRVDGAVFDANGNLFVSNSEVSTGIKVLLANGNWANLSYDGLNRQITLGTMLINSRYPNQKWTLSVRGNSGIGIFNDNGTIEDRRDDISKFMRSFTDTDGELVNPTLFYSIAQDHNGVIWVGTDQGPLLFHNTERVFDDGYTCSRVKIPRNDGTNEADRLLVTERIKAIAIDGANRKWLGTENSGVYLVSENGQETIHHFTTDNSPLLSDDIFSIAINSVSGEVFIATGAGLVSFQSDAASAGRRFGNVYAYPNPVRQNFHGVITITGLVHNTRVKITDLNGNLVAETVSNGSIATWDGRDGFGRRVNTGIYFAICVTEDGTESTITKIMVIN